MPIVEIEIVLKPNEIIQGEIVEELAEQLSEIFGSPKGTTWVKVRGLTHDHYAENGGTPDGVFPVFVSVLKSISQTSEEMQNEVERITGAVAQICRRPSGNVHVIYQPDGRGRVAFGGKLVS
jgi:phenylpyruvate tautomerase PptA (4-oxalocrotonate tautomerase family)